MARARQRQGLQRLRRLRAVNRPLWWLGAALVATAVMAVLAVATMQRQRAALEGMPDTIDRRRALRMVIIDAVTAESAQRGYLLTGDPAYLDGFDRWTPALALAALRQRYAAPPPELAEIDALLATKQAELRQTIELQTSGHPDAALALTRGDLGKHVMDRARAALQQIIDREDHELAAQFAANRRLVDLASPLVISGLALTVFALAIAFLALRRGTRALGRAAATSFAQAAQLAEQGAALRAGLDAASLANRALARSNRDLDQFAYVASHDLKAPLRAIASLSTWIEEDLGPGADERTREHLRLLRSRVGRMNDLIDGILGYSRAGRDTPVEAVDLRAVVEEVRRDLAPPAGVRVELSPGPWPTLTSRRVQLVQVWSNLLANAFIHGVPRGGRVELGCRGDATAVTCWVADDGPGIDPQYHDKIFDLFQRLAPRDEVEGAGIGLSIVRKLVDANGGRVWVESRVGEGTRFCFTWTSATPA